MKYLSRIEEIVLLAIWKLQGEAYGVTIRKQIAKDTGSLWMLGAIYAPLGRLLRNGYVVSSKSKPVAERGGRTRIYYELTKKGKKALVEINKVNASMWTDVPTLELE